MEVTAGARFIGLVGLNNVTFDARFAPAVEVGWRLARGSWGNGYATEAAHPALTFGFEKLSLDQIVAFTAAPNERSLRVMERLNMTHGPCGRFRSSRRS